MYINSISVILLDPNINPKHAHKPNDRVTRIQPKIGSEFSSCYISGTRCVNLVTNPMISHKERTGKCLGQVEHIRGHL